MAIFYEPKDGVSNSIAIVGEAPGKEEEESERKAVDGRGTPFIGKSGRLLTKALGQGGINRYNCFITNVCNVRPPNNDFSKLPKVIVEEGKRKLKGDLERWKPNVIFAIGANALTALTGYTGIDVHRGAVMPCTLCKGMKVVATYHPAYLLRGNTKLYPILVSDAAKVKRESLFPEIREPYRNINILYDKIEAISKLQELTSEREKPVVIDIETAGHILTAFGIGTSKEEAYVVPIELCRDPGVLIEIAKFCRSDRPKIFHNACYDVLWLAYYLKILTKNIYFDTMLAQHACYPMWRKSLGFCASLWTDQPFWKDEGKEAFDPKNLKYFDRWDQLYRYNAKDVTVTYEIYEVLRQKLVELGVEDVFKFDMGMIGPCLTAMLKGIKVDKNREKGLLKRNGEVIEKLQRVADAAIPGVNVNSSKQLKELFYRDWGLKEVRIKGKVSTGARALAKLEMLPTPYQPIFGLIRELKKAKKATAFFKIEIDEDGRARTQYKIAGTVTGRLSSATGITDSGSNLQNIPPVAREAFVADDGCIFLNGDLATAETRFVAALCGDEDWLREIDEDDIHWVTAEGLFHLKREQMRKDFHRQLAKKVEHGTHYCMTSRLLGELLHKSAIEAKGLMESYHALRPKLRVWQEKVREEIKRKREIRTPFGRRLAYPGWIGEDDVRQAVAFVPQSCCAYYINRGWQRMYDKLGEGVVLLQVHDSLLVQCPNDIDVVVKTFENMKACTEVKWRINGIDLVVPLDIKIGYDWKNMKEVKDVEEVREKYNSFKSSC